MAQFFPVAARLRIRLENERLRVRAPGRGGELRGVAKHADWSFPPVQAGSIQGFELRGDHGQSSARISHPRGPGQLPAVTRFMCDRKPQPTPELKWRVYPGDRLTVGVDGRASPSG